MSDSLGATGPQGLQGSAQGAGSAAPAAGDLIKDTTTQTFAADVLEASMQTPVIVDFWAPWCGPCKQLTPIIEKVVQQAQGAVKLVKMNIDEHPEVAQQLRVQSIPAVFAFKNGQPVDGFMGALPESQVKRFVEALAGGALAPTQAEQMLEAGQAALDAGDIGAAAQAFAAILQEDRENPKAIASLARCYIESGDHDRAAEVLGLAEGKLAEDPDVKGAAAALEVARSGAATANDDLAPLQAAVEADPANHQARFDLAVALNAAGDREGATDHLVEIVRRERKWNDEAAREQLVQFFEAWGPMDDATKAGRRKLSAVLFS
ncbi:thioredoxin [Pyruvatibacter mobilis]|uniref:thioredoxin n=1 Tax=Pyruvatibacter mobilis TaxID=1712261 RepID=UPI003BB0C19C